MATIRAEETWSRLFQCYWEHTDTWISFAQHLYKPADLRLMRRFLRETWDPRYRAITELGAVLTGRTPDQKLALIRQFGNDLLKARFVAEQMNLPLPDLSERDAAWQYAAVITDPDIQISGRSDVGGGAKLAVGSSADDPMFSAYRVASAILAADKRGFAPFVLVALRSTGPDEVYVSDQVQDAYAGWSNLPQHDLVYAALFENEGRAGTGKPRRLREYFPEESP